MKKGTKKGIKRGLLDIKKFFCINLLTLGRTLYRKSKEGKVILLTNFFYKSSLIGAKKRTFKFKFEI